jgi:hypothetical protein
MKYIEELKPGESFKIQELFFVLTSDFKKDGSKLAYSLCRGEPRWFKSDEIADPIEIYTLDQSNNIIPIKEKIRNEYSLQN